MTPLKQTSSQVARCPMSRNPTHHSRSLPLWALDLYGYLLILRVWYSVHNSKEDDDDDDDNKNKMRYNSKDSQSVTVVLKKKKINIRNNLQRHETRENKLKVDNNETLSHSRLLFVPWFNSWKQSITFVHAIHNKSLFKTLHWILMF